MRPARCFALGVVLLASMTSCNTTSTNRSDRRISVVATTTQVQDFVRVVGGSDVRLIGLLKPNVDPHDYEPAAIDTVEVARADVIVSSGAGVDAWVAPLIRSAEPDAWQVVASRGVDLIAGVGDEAGSTDPHVWHDPRNAEIMVTNITGALIAADPNHRADYRRRSAAYLAQLRALDSEIATEIATVKNRDLVTNHDAFGYYARRYGLTVVGSIIPSFDSSAELSASQLSTLIATIKSHGVRAVFSESSLPAKAAAAIAEEAGVKVVSGDDALYGDTLGPAGTDGDTYLKMMRHNTRTFVDNL